MIEALVNQFNNLIFDPNIKIVSGSNQYKIKFNFLNDYDANILLRAVFQLNNDIKINRFLDSNKCVVIPKEAIKKDGILKIGIVGAIPNPDIDIDMYKLLIAKNKNVIDVDNYLKNGRFSYNNIEQIIFNTNMFKFKITEGA